MVGVDVGVEVGLLVNVDVAVEVLVVVADVVADVLVVGLVVLEVVGLVVELVVWLEVTVDVTVVMTQPALKSPPTNLSIASFRYPAASSHASFFLRKPLDFSSERLLESNLADRGVRRMHSRDRARSSGEEHRLSTDGAARDGPHSASRGADAENAIQDCRLP